MSLFQISNKVKQLFSFCLDRQYHYILFISIIVVILSSKGISSESNFVIRDDMPRYLMNGVYFYDSLFACFTAWQLVSSLLEGFWIADRSTDSETVFCLNYTLAFQGYP